MNPQLLWPPGRVGAPASVVRPPHSPDANPRAGRPPFLGRKSKFMAVLFVLALTLLAMPRVPAQQRQDSPTAAADEEKQRWNSILGALRDTNHMRRTRDIYDAILKMSPGEIPSAVALAQRLPQKDRDELLRSLLVRWAETDPRAAMKFLFALDPGSRDSKIMGVAREWAKAEPQAAKEWALSLPPGGERFDALFSVTMAVAETDPVSALQFMQSLPPGSRWQSAYQNVFYALAAKNPEDAAGRALGLPPGQNRDQALRTVANTWTETNPQAALAWASKILEPGARRDVLDSAYRWWAAHDARAASATALALPAGEERDRALASIASTLNFSAPKSAATLVAQMSAGSARDQAISDVAGALARNDIAGALDWAAQLPDGKSKQAAQRHLVFEWMQTEPRAAADYFVKNEPPSIEDGNSMLGIIIGSWARNDPPQAIAWARKLTDEKVRADVLRRIIPDVAGRDPKQAVGLLAEIPAGRQRDSAGNLARAWMRHDPDAAAAWVLELPEGDAKISAMACVANDMAVQDLAKTAGWLEKLPPGASRDTAVREYTNRAVETDPPGATTWAATISDAKMRNNELERIASKWLRKDRDAASRWITQTKLFDEKTKKRLLPKN